jgi:hypothetical protein
MFSFSPGQGLVEHVFIDISWDYGWKLCGKKMMLDEKIDKVVKGEKKLKKEKRKRKEKCSFVLLRFYVDGA